MKFLACGFLSAGLALAAPAANAPPSPYIDQGACPFEGCAYRTWTASKPVVLIDRPPHRHKVARIVARLHPGDRVEALTGETHSIPLKLVATKDHPDPAHPGQTLIHQGDTFYVLHYLGEGAWLVWLHGRLLTIDNFLDTRSFPEAAWWVCVKTAAGITGWTLSNGNFDGQDSLARAEPPH